MRRLDVHVLENRGQRDVALREPLDALLCGRQVRDEAADLAGRELVVVDDVLVDPLEARGLVEGRAALRRVLPAMEDRVPLLLLEDALVAGLRELRTEPVVECVLLHLLQRDDVGGHGLQLLQDQVLAPAPRERPLLAVRVDGLGGVEVGENVPVHHLELLAQPLGIERAAVADHPACAGLLRSGDDGARGDRHAAGLGVPAVLQHRNDVQAKRAVDVLLARAVGPRLRHLDPLRDGLLEGIVLGLRPPHVLRQVVPAAEEALLGAVALEGLRHVADLRHLVGVEEAGLDHRTAQPAVAHVRTPPLVFEEAAVLVAERDVDRHLRYDHRAVPADQLRAGDRDRRLFVVAPRARPVAARGPG
mmetsp:Transcript_17523/g.52713  ORF Transcript_17523/g.52713 Transcript_17523/m.52713 type:complete len:361 (+) Transcript_17523:1043-2125(+)